MPYLALLFVSLLWGTSFVLIKSAAIDFSPVAIAVSRTVVAALFLLVVIAARRMRWPTTAEAWVKLTALAVMGQVLPFIMLGFAGHLTTSGDMALMMGAAPLLTFVLGTVIPPTEQPSLISALGLAVGFGGVAMALSAPLANTPSHVAGDVWLGRIDALVAAAGYAVGALISRNLAQRQDTTMIVTASMSISALLLGFWFVAANAMTGSAVMSWPRPSAVGTLIVLGIVNTAVAYVAYFRLIQTAGATFAGLNNYLVPPLGLAIGAFAVHERVSPALLSGLVLNLLGMVLVKGGTRRTGLSPIAPVGCDLQRGGSPSSGP